MTNVDKLRGRVKGVIRVQQEDREGYTKVRMIKTQDANKCFVSGRLSCPKQNNGLIKLHYFPFLIRLTKTNHRIFAPIP